ncbi:hypothetical protein AB0J20_03085 [Micromonospora costi]|uniref:hypothetical protein n=1 Tax=Micromonospora costi TaxID=1530042 RepID=UPI0033EC3531
MTDSINPRREPDPAYEPRPVDEPTTSRQGTPSPHGAAEPSPGATVPSPDTVLGPPASPKRSNARAGVIGGLALVVALAAGTVIGAAVGGDSDPAASARGSASPVPSSPSPTTAAPATASPTTTAPTTAVPTSAAPSPTRTTAPPKPKPPSYKTLSERQWKLIAKNPDAYIGKTYVVFGRVTQFDAATGVDTFRADVAHRRMAEKYDYETNTMLTGSASDLENLVEDDIFRANVTVLSSFSYDTQIGGETTVPLLMVDSIKVL